MNVTFGPILLGSSALIVNKIQNFLSFNKDKKATKEFTHLD